MLTRRTFIESAGVLAAGVAGGIAIPANGIKEHGLVELRGWFFTKEPIVIKSTIFSDERRGVFGVRLLDNRGLSFGLAELRVSAVRDAIDSPGKVEKTSLTGWGVEGKREDGYMDLVVKGDNLVIAFPGELEQSPPPGPMWMALSDVRQVL